MSDLYTREELRRAYAQAWAKWVARSALTPLEALISDVIGAHPEYHGIVADADAALAYEAPAGHENPFLHMGLHLAIREQLATDRPPGVQDLHRRLQAGRGGAHTAEHILMEALGETLREAQRCGRAPDELRYLALARRLAASRGTA